jgi:DNA-binding CsgD family transcriptional regulator
LEHSTRYRELLRPNGIEWELRASLVADGTCWGVIGLYRGPGESDFDHAEAAFVGAASRTLAEGFRRALLVAAVATDETPDGPGLIVLDPHDSTESLTPPAQRWLEELAEIDARTDALPAAVYAVAARARAAGHREPSAVQTRARACTRSGRWLVLHATKLNGTPDGTIAVIVEPARATEIAPLVVDAYGLSERERQVTQLVLQGLATSEIARTLFISPYTVQQHLKTIFDKIGVHSRRDLLARVFSDHYRPNLLREDTPALSPTGWFAEKPPLMARGR